MQLRQALRALGKTSNGKALINEILTKYKDKLGNRDFLTLEYTYYERLKGLDVGDKLNLSSSYYQQVLNTALAKLEMLIDDTTNAKILKFV